MLNQLARLAGLRTILVVDAAKHAVNLAGTLSWKANVVVDSHDPARSKSIIRAVAGESLRFAIDVVGRHTAIHLQECLSKDKSPPERLQSPTPPQSPLDDESGKASVISRRHLVGLTGLPKTGQDGIQHHNVPVKLFHEVPEVGSAITSWLYRLLLTGAIHTPAVLGTVHGLCGINEGLDRMRRHEISGGKLVAVLR